MIKNNRSHLSALSIAICALSIVGFAGTAQAEECNDVHEIAITHTFEPGDMYAKPGDCFRFTNIHMIEHSAVG